MTKITALMSFLAKAAKSLGVGDHVFIVGGAVRNHLLGLAPKDIDLAVDSVALGGKDSAWFAEALQRIIPVRSNLTTNQYGVAILTISEEFLIHGHNFKGEILEIANARKESYGGESGKGYKPHVVEPATIEEDLLRREFTVNTLLWRLSDLEQGPDHAPVLDLLGVGVQDLLHNRLLRTPSDPDKTFSDDPTRMLRAVKFVAKYGFTIDDGVRFSIERNAPKLKQMPWDAVRKILVEDILEGPRPRASLALIRDLGLGAALKEMLEQESGFSSALSRSLNDLEIHLVLDLMDLGWGVRTPVSFFGEADLQNLRGILLAHADDHTFEKRFLESLKRPDIDQVRLFDKFGLKGKDRGMLVPLARSLLLGNPGLAKDAEALEHHVEEVLQQRFKQPSGEVPGG